MPLQRPTDCEMAYLTAGTLVQGQAFLCFSPSSCLCVACSCCPFESPDRELQSWYRCEYSYPPSEWALLLPLHRCQLEQ